MSIIDKRISTFIPNQLPAFIQSDYETFISFLKAYFEWLETTKLQFTYITEDETFVKGENVKGTTTNAEGFIRSIDTSKKDLNVDMITEKLFQVDETIIGLDSGAQATLTKFENNVVAATNHYLKLRDIDNTIDDFVDSFRKEFAENFPDIDNVDKRTLYKNIKEFYHNKGNENSFNFLFQVLYNEKADFYYPSKDIFRTSDNSYEIKKIIRVSNSSGLEFEGREIQGSESGAKATVNREYIIKVNNIFVRELELIDSTIEGNFFANEFVSTTDSNTISKAKIYGIVNGYTITDAGNDYEPKDSLTITSNDNGVSADIIVDTIKHGFIDSIEIGNAGSGYAVGDSLVFSNTTDQQGDNFVTASGEVGAVDGSGAITAINLYSRGIGYKKLPTITITTSGGSGAVLFSISESIGAIKQLTIKNPGINYNTKPTFDLSSIGKGNATITANIGALYDKEEGFENNDSFPSHNKFLIDSYYYQNFSYVIKINQSIDKWRNVIKKLLHPAGMIFFNIYRVNNSVSSKVKLPSDITNFFL